MICRTRERASNPEIDIQIPSSAKLAVPDLECDRQHIFLVKLFVEALARIRTQLDAVPQAQAHYGSQADPKLSETHFFSLVDC